MIIDIPYLHCYIRESYLHDLNPDYDSGLVEAYAFSVTALLNRPLLFTVHTEHGAIFSRLPIQALCPLERTDKSAIPEDLLQPWGCLGERIEVIQHAYLKDYEITVPSVDKSGIYKMTFDFMPGGHFEEDPEQHKTMNLIEMDCGQFMLLPNNMILAKDAHFVNHKSEAKYQRNTHYFMTKG